jgi:hydrogenase/urease accessory protein HupE
MKTLIVPTALFATLTSSTVFAHDSHSNSSFFNALVHQFSAPDHLMMLVGGVVGAIAVAKIIRAKKRR